MDRLMGTMGGAAVQAYRDASRRTGPTFVLSKVDVITLRLVGEREEELRMCGIKIYATRQRDEAGQTCWFVARDRRDI